MRYEPDTGVTESNTRPLFQGQSRVGLQGDFGMVRLGRGLTPFQEIVAPPSNRGTACRTRPASIPTSRKSPASTRLRWTARRQLGATASRTRSSTTRQSSPASRSTLRGPPRKPTAAPPSSVSALAAPQYPANTARFAQPVLGRGTYNNGPAAAMLAYERNAVESKSGRLQASFAVTPELKLMATYSEAGPGQHQHPAIGVTKGWLLGANYTIGPGKVLAGYGQKTPDNADQAVLAGLRVQPVEAYLPVHRRIAQEKATAAATFDRQLLRRRYEPQRSKQRRQIRKNRVRRLELGNDGHGQPCPHQLFSSGP
jgi:hypothetical protein